jgi:hypothetical protein
MNSHLQEIVSSPSNDAEYTFGRPKLYLAPRELARLTILRSKLGDTRAERAAEPLVTTERRCQRSNWGTPPNAAYACRSASGRSVQVISPPVV